MPVEPSPCRASTGRPRRHPASAPTWVFILADDLGYADLGCTGRPDFKTPNIDRIAAEGLHFTQAYANSAVCSATRTALITGRYQDRLAIGLEEPLAANVAGLPPSHPTPALSSQGPPATAPRWSASGISASCPTLGRLKSGYEHYFGIRGGAADYYAHDKTLWTEDVPAHEAGYLTDLFGDHAVRLIEDFARGPGALPAQPALHGAALALGRLPGRRARPNRRGSSPGTTPKRWATSTAATRRPMPPS